MLTVHYKRLGYLNKGFLSRKLTVHTSIWTHLFAALGFRVRETDAKALMLMLLAMIRLIE